MQPCLKLLSSSLLISSSRSTVSTVAAFSNTASVASLFSPLADLDHRQLPSSSSIRKKNYHRHRRYSAHARNEPSRPTTMPPKKSKKDITNVSSSSSSSSNVLHAPESLFQNTATAIDRTRTKLLTPSVSTPRSPQNLSDPCIVYWMIRDVRTKDNWAMLFAQSLAVQYQLPLRVMYVLPPPPDTDTTNNDEEEYDEDAPPPNPIEMSPTQRHGSFLLEGLQIVSRELENVHVPFDILRPSARDTVGETVLHQYCTTTTATSSTTTTTTSSHHNAIAIICDMSPLKTPRHWTEIQTSPLLQSHNIPLLQVDAHNIVPVWMASSKREVGARTLRKKIHELFGDYCCSFPEFVGNAHLNQEQQQKQKLQQQHDWKGYETYMKLDTTIQPVDGMIAGAETAMKRWNDFLSSSSKGQGLQNFDTLRNDPTYQYVCSNLSPYINTGQISFQRLALDIRALKKHPNGTAAFIEEGVVRRELSDNYVYYTPDVYDSLEGAAEWARDSLELHSVDEREYLYTWKALERGETHDELWNAGQMQLVREGGMHGFMRMYWAKKILEWTPSPSYALATAQYFNDRYAYDGNDPNGYVGVGWSIMGIHDMGWKERPIFGKIRYMNYAGCKRKFKIDAFVARYRGAKENAAKALSGDKKSGDSNNVSGKKRKKG